MEKTLVGNRMLLLLVVLLLQSKYGYETKGDDVSTEAGGHDSSSSRAIRGCTIHTPAAVAATRWC
jgi:hypothetical protein